VDNSLGKFEDVCLWVCREKGRMREREREREGMKVSLRKEFGYSGSSRS
jgi:hypothetical protein